MTLFHVRRQQLGQKILAGKTFKKRHKFWRTDQFMTISSPGVGDCLQSAMSKDVNEKNIRKNPTGGGISRRLNAEYLRCH
ncbi:hypothetical protein ATANTOWER_010103 [Ataeniobius toweri]|uniref:Uncharacterized protein n=1 Tax=Ataeniobius toweri TaxID=208326 RepID=A0ABU7BFI6_9TELE|nr:hypothetical protein [Ataeniobius toweri]